jgi:3'-5' exoribonuclease
MKTIAELTDGDHVQSQFLVTAVAKGVTANSRSYLTVTLQDATGTLDAKKWDVEEADNDIFVPGNIVAVEAEVLSYKNILQLKILSGEALPQESIDFTRFVPSAPVPKAELIKKLEGYLASLQNPQVKKLTEYLVKKHYDAYVNYPAAVRNHHNFASGLLYHSLCMADDAEALAKLYPGLNRDVLVAGALIHDIGKTIELSGPVATKFTLDGRLLGHISIMQAEVKEAADALGLVGEIPAVMEHMILSHHNKPEFGSPVLPETREAVALAAIDDFDAKMAILDKAYQGVKPGEWTQKVLTMDDRYFYLPLYTMSDKKD